ncbi:hypothetical protein ACRAKI_21080 [Saccharothrix isguenensis]
MSRQLPFEVPNRILGPEELDRIAEAVGKRPGLWRDRLRTTVDDRTYTEVFTSEHLDVWAISWMADGHDTGYHDHDHSSGAVYVACGAIRHEQLRLGERPTGAVATEGHGFRFDNTFIHRMRREPRAGPTVTIHAYSPPLSHTGQYAEHEDGLLHRTPTSSKEQLVPHGPQGTPSDS